MDIEITNKNIAKTLRKMYQDKKMSSNEISKIFKCSPKTILALLKKHNIKIRSKSKAIKAFFNINIPKKELDKLYLKEKLSSVEIARKFKCSPSLIRNKLREYKIPIRSIQESHIICNKPKYPQYDFSENLQEKAYLLGLRKGDLYIHKRSEKSNSIYVQMGSTKRDMINLVKECFSPYNYVRQTPPDKKGVITVKCSLNKTFNFLLEKKDLIEKWILNDPKYFLPFLAGYVDSEGTFCLCRNNAVFSIRSQDKNIIKQIRKKLIELNIFLRPARIVRKKGTKDIRGTIANKDIWAIYIHRKDSLIKLINILKPYIKHKDKQKRMDILIENINLRNKKYNNRQDTKWYKEYLLEGINI